MDGHRGSHRHILGCRLETRGTDREMIRVKWHVIESELTRTVGLQGAFITAHRILNFDRCSLDGGFGRIKHRALNRPRSPQGLANAPESQQKYETSTRHNTQRDALETRVLKLTG